MCGVPYHSVDAYIARLVQPRATRSPSASRWRTRPPAKGLVQRDIIRIVTPGTVTESCMLDEKQKQLHRLHLRRKRKIRPCLLRRFHRRVLHHGLLRTDPERSLYELGRFAPSEILRYGSNVDCEVIDDAVFRRLKLLRQRGKAGAVRSGKCGSTAGKSLPRHPFPDGHCGNARRRHCQRRAAANPADSAKNRPCPHPGAAILHHRPVHGAGSGPPGGIWS